MVNNSLVKKDDNKPKTFSNFLMGDAIKKKINETVGGANGQRFITSILSAVSTNPALQECEHGSIISAAFLGEALKLSPSPQLGQYYMVPFNAKSGRKDASGNDIYIKKAQFQIGYKGYIQLAIRSGQYKDIDVIEIREGEYLGRDKTTGKHKFEFIEDEVEREEKEIIGYMAYFEYLNGFTKQLYWSKEKMLKHADTYSKAFSAKSYKLLQEGKIPEKDKWKYSSFWYKDFDGMAYKTMLRRLIDKWGIMSIEMQEAYNKDMATIKEDGSYEYIETQEQDIDDTIQADNMTTADTIENEKIEEITTTITTNTIKNSETIENDFQENEVDDFFN